MKRIVLIIVAFVMLFHFPIIPIVNNIHASNQKNTLLKIPLPENTELIDAISIAGKLVGNGNGMQYFGAILIKSELPIDELSLYYSQYRNSDRSYYVEVQNGKYIESIHDKGFFSVSDEVVLINHFIVSTWGSSIGLFSEWDLRGH